MGELFFIADGRKISGMLTALAFFILELVVLVVLVKHYNVLTVNAFLFFFIPAIVFTWYGFDKLLTALVNKILFFEKGMKIVKGFSKYTILMTDIKDFSISKQEGDNNFCVFNFKLNDGNTITINENDYADFSILIKEYAKKFNLDWSYNKT